MNYLDARDKIHEPFYSVWKETGYPVVWEDSLAKPPSTETCWARVTIAHVSAGQTSLGCGNDRRRYERIGQLNIQLFAPVHDGNVQLYELGQQIVDAYQAARYDDIWFRRVSLLEAMPEGAFQQMNVSAIFTYEDIR